MLVSSVPSGPQETENEASVARHMAQCCASGPVQEDEETELCFLDRLHTYAHMMLANLRRDALGYLN